MKIALAASVLFLGFQDGDSLEEKLEAKRKSAFLAKAPWFTDLAKAREEGARTGRPIFGYFTRSYSP